MSLERATLLFWVKNHCCHMEELTLIPAFSHLTANPPPSTLRC